MSYYGGYGGCGGGILGNVLGMAGGYGGRCGADTLFYHWRCCTYNPYECCFELEGWFIAFLVICAIGFLICLCACLAGCVYTARNRQQ